MKNMFLTKTSELTGNTSTMEIPMSEEEFAKASALWKTGALIQNAFPSLNADLREFIKTGITPAEWNDIFPNI